MKLEVFNIQGEKVGREVEMPESIFGVEPNDHVVYLAVKQYLANQRQGTHKSKERSEISGSTRKLKRQKGTGTARSGDINSPVFVGGGRVFGPRPRNYTLKLNKKVKLLARKCALSTKLSNNQILVVEDFSFDSPKTKSYLGILQKLNVADSRSLVVIPDYNETIFLSSRNIPKSLVMAAKDINTYEILKANYVVLSEQAVEKIKESFK